MSTTTTTPTPTASSRRPSGRVHKGIRSAFSDPFDEHRSVQVDQTCFLCQREIIQRGRFRLELEAFDWQPLDRALVAMYFDGRDIDTFQQVSRPLLFSRRRTDGELSLFGRRRRVIFKNTIPLESHSDCGRCFPSRGVYLAHRQCWQVARSVFPAQLERLLRFAIATRALFPPPARYPSQDLSGLHGLSTWVNRETDLGKLLQAVEMKLPTELQSKVTKELAGTPLWHMLHVRFQAIPLIAKADRYNLDLDPLHVPVRGHEDDGLIKTLSASFETLFFVDYIKDLQFNSLHPNSLTIPVRDERTQGINFAVSKHGLRGLKIMYADGSESPWLGSTVGCWFGSAYGEDLQQLIMLKSVFTVMRIAFGVSNLLSENDKNINGHKVIHPFWDRPLFFSPNHSHAFRPLETGSLSIMIPYYTNWRLFHHLPLVFDDGYASGITFWNARTGKCGVTVHGPPRKDRGPYRSIRPPESVTIGVRQGIATHFALATHEVITAVWIRESGSAGSSPVVTLGTSLGRRVNFAPHLYCTVATGEHLFTEGWTAVGSNDQKVTGLFFHANDRTDNPAITEPGLSKELGVILETPLRQPPSKNIITTSPCYSTTTTTPSSSSSSSSSSSFSSSSCSKKPLTALPRANIPAPPLLPLHREASAHSIFSSHASLTHVSTISLRRRGPRILGLCITHTTGPRETLGQWIPPSADIGNPTIRHATIYNLQKDPPTIHLAGLDIHLRDLDPPVSSASRLMIVSHVDVVRRSSSVEPGETAKRKRKRKREREREVEEERAMTTTVFPVGHSRGTRVLKAFRAVGDMRIVWWMGFAGDEVVLGSHGKEGMGVEVEVEKGMGRVVL